MNSSLALGSIMHVYISIVRFVTGGLCSYIIKDSVAQNVIGDWLYCVLEYFDTEAGKIAF